MQMEIIDENLLYLYKVGCLSLNLELILIEKNANNINDIIEK
jgi:hypothetical protein